MYCPFCGSQNPLQASFCNKCGQKMNHDLPQSGGPVNPGMAAGGPKGKSRAWLYGIAVLVMAALIGFMVFSDDPVPGKKGEQPMTQSQGSVSPNKAPAELHEPEYAVYRNSRYGFSIDIPRHFIADPPPTNGDGQMYHSPGGDAVIRVYGSNVFQPTTTRREYDQMISDKGSKLGYHTSGQDWFVVTWQEPDGTVFYHKSHVGPGSINSFSFSYPQGQKQYYEKLIQRMEGSFRRGDISRAH